MSPYQLKIVKEFLESFLGAWKNYMQQDNTPTGDVEFDEFMGIMNESVLISIPLPKGKTKHEYMDDLEEALQEYFKDDVEVHEYIKSICSQLRESIE